MTTSNLEEDNPFNIELPVNITDNSLFSRIGLEFAPFENGDLMRSARLPKGWRLVELNKREKHLVDENNSIRVVIFNDGSKCQAQIKPRFVCGLDTTIPDANIRARICVWDKKKNEVVFEVSTPIANKQVSRAAHERGIQSLKDKKECLQWLEKNFPDWESPNAYWDED